MGLLEAASFACAWGLMRLTLNEPSWYLIATAQLASNAVSRLIPGGAASGGTASYQLFTATGAPPERVVSGLTATTLISTAVLFSLPVLSLPAILFGGAAGRPHPAARPHLRHDRLRPYSRRRAPSACSPTVPCGWSAHSSSGRATACWLAVRP